jgi:integral membrane protein
MIDLLSTTLGKLRVVAFVEGVSFLLLLFIAMPLKYWAGLPQMVRVVGMAHGLLFVLYVLYAVLAKVEYGWNLRKLALALLASVVPFGTFYADKRLFRTAS